MRRIRVVARKEGKMGMAMEMGWEEMGMVRMGENRRRWPITTLVSFKQHGAPLPQIRPEMLLSRKPLVAVPPRMCNSLQCSRPTCDCRRRSVS
jgi:hypothetical protein